MKKKNKEDKSGSTLEILDYLQKNIPGMDEDGEEDMEMPEEEEEELALMNQPRRKKPIYQ